MASATEQQLVNILQMMSMTALPNIFCIAWIKLVPSNSMSPSPSSLPLGWLQTKFTNFLYWRARSIKHDFKVTNLSSAKDLGCVCMSPCVCCILYYYVPFCVFGYMCFMELRITVSITTLKKKPFCATGFSKVQQKRHITIIMTRISTLWLKT